MSKRIVFKDGTFRPQYWLLGWKTYKDRKGNQVEFLDQKTAYDCLERHNPYSCLQRFIASSVLSVCLGFVLLYLTVNIW